MAHEMLIGATVTPSTAGVSHKKNRPTKGRFVKIRLPKGVLEMDWRPSVTFMSPANWQEDF